MCEQIFSGLENELRYLRSTLRYMWVELLIPLMVTVQVNLPESSGNTSAMMSEHTPLPYTIW